MDVFRRLDFNIKATDNIQERTVVGGIVSVGSAFICFLLLISELWAFTRVDVVNHMTVDSTPSAGTVPINFHITFPVVDCKDITFEAESTRGEHVVHIVEQDIEKFPATGKETKLSREGQGCTVKGTIMTGKVAGEFRINLGKPQELQLASMVAAAKDFNLTSHKIHHFSFGERTADKAYPLDDLETIPDAEGHYLYNLRVIPTVDKKLNQDPKYNYQFSFQESLHKGLHLSPGITSALTFSAPGIHFFYDFYPIMVEYSERKTSFLQFVTSVAAIVGGIFTVSSLLDSCIYQSARVLKKQA